MLTTRVGTLTLMVPQDRDGTFSSKLFARYQRTEKAFVLALMEMYVVGVSTRKVARVTEELCGTCEIVAVSFEDTENEATYQNLFANLKACGLSGVVLVTSDAHPGLKAANARHFQGASWQRCQVHFDRDLLKTVACKHRKRLAADLKEIWTATILSAALDTAPRIAGEWRDTHPKAAEAIDEECEECLTVLHFPADHRIFLRTNNALERFKQEIKRRTRVVRIFPNEESCLRLVSAMCVETGEEWMTNRRSSTWTRFARCLRPNERRRQD